MRDDLGREGRELREEGCSQALAVCLLVGLKTTCVEIIQCVDGACRAILISTQKATGGLLWQYTKIAQIAGGSQRQLEVAVARSSQAQTQAMYVTDSLLGGVFWPIRHT